VKPVRHQKECSDREEDANDGGRVEEARVSRVMSSPKRRERMGGCQKGKIPHLSLNQNN